MLSDKLLGDGKQTRDFQSTYTEREEGRGREKEREGIYSDIIKDQNFEVSLTVEVHGVKDNDAKRITTVGQKQQAGNPACFKTTISILVYCRVES